MEPLRTIHSWDVSPKEAIQIQKELRSKLIFEDRFDRDIRLIAGCDMSIDKKTESGIAGVIVYTFPELKEVERCSVLKKIEFPYVPGLLSFREGPVLLELFRELKSNPDLFIFDGQGMAHPRRVGIASHMGLWLNKPSIGCAKSRLCGFYKEPESNKGARTPLLAREGDCIGSVLRTKVDCLPIFVSPGHLIGMKTSLNIILKCLDGYRLPKPTREADRYVAAVKKEILNERLSLTSQSIAKNV